MNRINPIIKNPVVGQIIRRAANNRETYYANGGSFRWVILAPKDPLPESHLSELQAASDSDFIVDLTDGEQVVLDDNNTSYLMPRSVSGGWECLTTSADAVLGVQYDG